MQAAVIIALSWVLIFEAYYLLPTGHGSGLRALLRVGADIALVGAVLAWQTRRIGRAEFFELRAIEALGIVIALFLGVFSAIYLSVSYAVTSTFSQQLDHTKALFHHYDLFDSGVWGYHPTDGRAAALQHRRASLERSAGPTGQEQCALTAPP